MTVQYQLRDNETLSAAEARIAVCEFMQNPAASVIVNGCATDYVDVMEVVADIEDANTFRVELTDCGVQLRLVGSDITASLALNGLRREMDNFGRWFAIPKGDTQ